MKAKTRLAIWIGNKKRTYADGFSLYKELAINPKSNQFFDTRAPSTMQENMLSTQLFRFARIKNVKPLNPREVKQAELENEAAFKQIIKRQNPKASVADKLAEATRVKIFKNPEVDYKELPDNLKAVYDLFEGLYKSYDAKRMEMNDLPVTVDKNETRKKYAQEIVALRKTISANWNEIDTWWQNRNKEPEGTVVAEPTGKLTKAEIETIADAEIKALSKKLRIEANLKYIGRNVKSERDKTKVSLAFRKQELDEWGVSYAEIVAKNS